MLSARAAGRQRLGERQLDRGPPERAQDVGAQAPLLHRRGERLDDLEVDVGLQQREADLAHGGIDVGLGQRAALPDIRQRALELLGKGVEHGSDSVAGLGGRAAGYAARPGTATPDS